VRKHWWKILGVLCLAFAITAGIFTPLSPGISDVQPEFVTSDSTYTLNFYCQNAHLQSNVNSLQCFLSADSGKIMLCGKNIQVKSAHRLTADFYFGGNLFKGTDRIKYLDAAINNDQDGTFAEFSAIRVNKDTTKNAGSNPTQCSVTIKNIEPHFFSFPYRDILLESIRNLYFHVPMWFAMIIILLVSAIYSIRYLYTFNTNDDLVAAESAKVGLLFGICGIITGSMWAKTTWGAYWNNDPKESAAAVGLLMYFGYLVLRNSIADHDKRARVAAVTNIFFYAIFIPLIFVLPRLTDSLHPGNGGNPGFNSYDLDNHMRIVFYPAVIGWTLLGSWLVSIRCRIRKLENKLESI
jgi:heme exporter protein C